MDNPQPGGGRRRRPDLETVLPAPPPLALSPGLVLQDRFELVRMLGRGGMGEVWLAQDRSLRLRRALKFVPRDMSADRRALRALESEAQIAARLRHPGIVALQSLERLKREDHDSDTVYLVMEYVAGWRQPDGELWHSLDDWLFAVGTLDEARVRAVLGAVLDALAYAHDFRDDVVTAGIVHRDIKPANILLDDKGKPVVADFGIARAIRSSMSRLTGAAGTAGTMPYMSPEQLTGGAVDGRSDIYAVGMMAFELLTGEPPFIEGDITWKHRELAVPAIPGASADINAWIARATAKKPEDRWPTAKEAARALDTAAREVRVVVPPPAPAPAPPPVCPPSPAASLSSPGTTAGERRVLQLAPGVEMGFRWIPPGSFLMGSPPSEERRDADETPYRVALTRGFWMAETETTQAQWYAVMGTDPSHFKGATLPVETVSWDDATAFCRKVSSTSGLRVSLPTEAQWEYACRAGTTTAYHSGDDEAALAKAGWYNGCGSQTKPVGHKVANAWGLHDMHGNVWEWCADWYGGYPSQGAIDPTGPSTGTYRVYRGGSWRYFPADCRSAYRGRCTPDNRDFSLGFRVVSVPEPPLPSASVPQPAPPTPRPEPPQPPAQVRPSAPAPVVGITSSGSKAGERRVVELAAGVEMAFRWIPAGSFTMGSPASEEGRSNDETPHRVTLTRGFWMAETETTQAQWRAVMGTDPSHFKGATLPVEKVSWDDAQSFCRKLSSFSGLRVSLPTEAQWEYACRAGTTIAYHSGSGGADLARAAWYSANSGGKTQPVGGKEANDWGLKDMHGNVWEWCADWFDPYSKRGWFGSSPGADATDPTGPSTGTYRVFRGGSWGDGPAFCRSAIRRRFAPDDRRYSLGFRVVSLPG